MIPVGEATASPQADVTWWGMLCLRTRASAVWEMSQHHDPGGWPFSSLARTTNPDSPHMSLVHSDLPLPTSKVSGCKQIAVHWLLKKLVVSLAIYLWWTETPLLFIVQCYLGSFSGSDVLCCGGELGVYTTHFSGGTTLPWPLKYPSSPSHAAHESRALPAFLQPCSPEQSHCGDFFFS